MIETDRWHELITDAIACRQTMSVTRCERPQSHEGPSVELSPKARRIRAICLFRPGIRTGQFKSPIHKNPARLSYSRATVHRMIDGTVPDDTSAPHWVEFARLLNSRLAALPPSGSVGIDLNGTEVIGAPFVQILKSIEGDELYAEFSSNEFLGESFRLTDEQVNAVLALGWFPPDSPNAENSCPNFYVALDAADAHDLATLVGATFRKVYPRIEPESLSHMMDTVVPQTGSVSDGIRVDESQISDSWSEFAAHFASELLNLGEDERVSVFVDQSLGQRSPSIQATTFDNSRFVLMEVSSNQTLLPENRLSGEQIGALLALGWSPPSAPNEDPQLPTFHTAGASDDIAHLAMLVVDTLRSVFGIPHPSFLKPAPREEDLHRHESDADPHAGEELLPIDLAYKARDLADLHWAVSHVIRNSQGGYVPPDEHGTFALRMGSSGLLISVREPGAISVLAFVVTKMRYPDRASEILQQLNDSALFARFYVEDGDVIATCDIPGRPFVPEHLIEVMVTVGRLIDNVDDEIAAITGGTVLFGGDYRSSVPDPAEDDLPEELLALIHMDNDPKVSVEPELTARLMRRDRELILRCTRLCEEQEISWREAAEDESDEEERDAQLHEAQAWDRTVSLLRQALVFTVE